MSQISNNYLQTIVYIDENINYGTAVINTDNWIQPETDDDIVKMTTHIANVFSAALLKSSSIGQSQFDVIVLLDKFKVKNINYKFVKYLTSILKQLFPDKLRKATLIDPPRYFVTAYDIIKTFLDKPTRKKFHLISSSTQSELYADDLS